MLQVRHTFNSTPVLIHGINSLTRTMLSCGGRMWDGAEVATSRFSRMDSVTGIFSGGERTVASGLLASSATTRLLPLELALLQSLRLRLSTTQLLSSLDGRIE